MTNPIESYYLQSVRCGKCAARGKSRAIPADENPIAITFDFVDPTGAISIRTYVNTLRQ